jgi:cell division initiation protein
MYDPRMQLTSEVLRQVEFGSELRGYRTSEVDDFLEKVAVSVDGLNEQLERAQADLADLRQRVERAEQSVGERVPGDEDDSLRRMLLLAQRTADLAVQEAQDEAAKVVESARREASSIVADARTTADRVVTDADRKLQEEVSRLRTDREKLRSEMEALVKLVGAERDRLTESLNTTLGYVQRNLSIAPDLVELLGVGGDTGRPSPRDREPTGGEDSDLEAQIAEDAAAAGPGASPRYSELDDDWESPKGRSRLTALPTMKRGQKKEPAPKDASGPENQGEAVWDNDGAGTPAS